MLCFNDGCDVPVGFFELVSGLDLRALFQVGHRAWLASDEDDRAGLDLNFEVADLDDPVRPGRADGLDRACNPLRRTNAGYRSEAAAGPRPLLPCLWPPGLPRFRALIQHLAGQ